MTACADSAGNSGQGGAGGAAGGMGTPGVLVAEPNPIQVCEGTVGVTTLHNRSSVPGAVEIRIGSSTGKLFAAVGRDGKAETGKWVTDGMQFVLLNGSETIGSVTVGLTRQGCP